MRMKSQGCVSFVSLLFLKGTGPTPCTGTHVPTDTHQGNTHTHTESFSNTFVERKSIFTAFYPNKLFVSVSPDPQVEVSGPEDHGLRQEEIGKKGSIMAEVSLGG